MITLPILSELVSCSKEEKFSAYLLDFFREKLKKQEGFSSGEIKQLHTLSDTRKAGFNQQNLLRCAAEILLLQKILNRKKISSGSAELLGDISPFGNNTPSLKDLLCCRRGCMVNIPLHGNPPLAMRVYLLENPGKKRQPDMRNIFRTQDNRIWENFSVYVQFSDFSPHPFTGDSWRLGVTLGKSFLSESRGEVLYALARDWMITGTVKADDAIGGIRLGNKMQLDPGGQWKWLLPECNLKDLDESHKSHCTGVRNLKDAQHWIRGSGFQSGKTLNWSGKVDIFYVLLGGSWTSVFYSIFYFRPKKVILFITEKTRKIAQWICPVLEDNPWHIPEIQCEDVDSNDLAQMDNDFRRLQEKLTASGKKQNILFNITGGNRLMGLAAHMVATDYQIPMIYRDLDSPEGIFEYLEHLNQGQYLHSKQRVALPEIHKEDCAEWSCPNWKKLSGPPPKESLPDAKAIKEYIFS